MRRSAPLAICGATHSAVVFRRLAFFPLLPSEDFRRYPVPKLERAGKRCRL